MAAYTTIKNPGLHFNTKLYAGSNSTQAVTGVGFQPNWVWIKNRSSTPDHKLHDSVRGSNKNISSNTSNAEQTYTYFNSFDSDGFTLDGNVSDYNQNGSNFVSWNWKGNALNAANSDGATASTVNVNSTAGFSIVSWTGTGSGTTIGHGLGAKPKIIFVKNRTSATNWVVNVGELVGADERSLRLNSTNAVMADAAQAGGYTYNNQTATFQTANGSNGNQNDVNESGSNIIAYCFKEVRGYSKFGIYTGNGNADGPFVYTGFRPAFLIIKPSSKAEEWTLLDNKRLGYNIDNNYVYPNRNYAEMTADRLDILSNGFKLRSATGELNTSSATMIYMAFAELPLVGDNPAPAR